MTKLPQGSQPFEEVSRSEYIAHAINSIKKDHPKLRQASKAPTFALTYQGTYKTLMRTCGFSEKEAKAIEKKYHDRFKVSDKWVQDALKKASKIGYVTAAFGLRVRTPLLSATVYGAKKTPYEAQAEARTAGNALGQSWCILNCRAANEFMERVWASQYRYDIKPCAQIHDAIYLLIPNNTQALHWVNINLIECMQWCDDPLLDHPTVKLGAELDVHYRNWSQPITLPNNATPEDIIEHCHEGALNYV